MNALLHLDITARPRLLSVTESVALPPRDWRILPVYLCGELPFREYFAVVRIRSTSRSCWFKFSVCEKIESSMVQCSFERLRTEFDLVR